MLPTPPDPPEDEDEIEIVHDPHRVVLAFFGAGTAEEMHDVMAGVIKDAEARGLWHEWAIEAPMDPAQIDAEFDPNHSFFKTVFGE